MKPTKEQEQKFWGLCGLKPIKREGSDEIVRWELPSGGWRFFSPDIDLNNLFKYAVPQLREKGCRAMLSDKTEGDDVMYMGRAYGRHTNSFLDAYDKDPALALFWAIDKVREAENED